MKFNLSKFVNKKAMAVAPMPDEISKPLSDDYSIFPGKATSKDFEMDLPPEDEYNCLSISKKMKQINYRGKTVGLYSRDKKNKTFTIYDPETKKFEKVPEDDPDIKAVCDEIQKRTRPDGGKLLGLIDDWNSFIKNIDDKQKNLSIANLPLQLAKEKEVMIQPRIEELERQKFYTEARIETLSTNPYLEQFNEELKKRVNNQELSLRDEIDTIFNNLYEFIEDQIIEDIDSGSLTPSEEFKNRFLAPQTIFGEDGEEKTVTKLETIVNKILNERKERLEKKQKSKIDKMEGPVPSHPTEILRELPPASFRKEDDFHNVSHYVKSLSAQLSSINEEMRQLKNLDETLANSLNILENMKSKSDAEILNDPTSFMSIMHSLKEEAASFLKKHTSDIKVKDKVWNKRGPNQKTRDGWSDAQKEQFKEMPDGSFIMPGMVDSRKVGPHNVASAAVTLYLHKILYTFEKIEERLERKGVNVQQLLEEQNREKIESVIAKIKPQKGIEWKKHLKKISSHFDEIDWEQWEKESSGIEEYESRENFEKEFELKIKKALIRRTQRLSFFGLERSCKFLNIPVEKTDIEKLDQNEIDQINSEYVRKLIVKINEMNLLEAKQFYKFLTHY